LTLLTAALLVAPVEPYDTGIEGARAYAVSESPDGRRQVVTRQERGALPVLYWRERGADGNWGPAEPIDLPGLNNAADGFFTPDGESLIFMHLTAPPSRQWDVWRVALTPHGWGEPVRFDAISDPEANEVYPTMDARGRIVFASNRGLSEGRAIWMATPHPEGGGYELERLEGAINDNPTVSNPLILPDGEAIIFYTREPETTPGSAPDVNLFMSCVSDGVWSAAMSLGSHINTPGGEFAPGLSHDGEYLYFTRGDDVHRADMALVEGLRRDRCTG
jgi:hypothetical protein